MSWELACDEGKQNASEQLREEIEDVFWVKAQSEIARHQIKQDVGIKY